MKLDELLRQELEAIKNDLIQKHIELKLKASGQWERSLTIETSENKATLYGLPYTYQMQHGRRAGKMPPIKAIKQWIIHKGIAEVTQEAKVSSLAYLIARKIANEGTKAFRNGGTDLINSVITPKRIQNIISKIGTFYVAEFTSEVINLLNQTAKE